MKKAYLGVDLGTTGTKSMLFDENNTYLVGDTSAIS